MIKRRKELDLINQKFVSFFNNGFDQFRNRKVKKRWEKDL